MLKQNFCPISVCFNITSKCNDHCRFCYRNSSTIDLDTVSQLRVVRDMAISGIKKITFVGGEPLLIDSLPDCMNISNKHGAVSSLVTNGLLLSDRWNEICKYIFWLTLPLDHVSDEVLNSIGRTPSQLDRIDSHFVMHKTKNILHKINTVVSRHNVGSILDISKEICKYPINIWKIFRFFPVRGKAKQNSDDFFISDNEFYHAISDAVKYAQNCGIKCIIADWKYLRNNYVNVCSNGKITKTMGTKDIVIGDLTSDSIVDIYNNRNYNVFYQNNNHNYLIDRTLPQIRSNSINCNK